MKRLISLLLLLCLLPLAALAEEAAQEEPAQVVYNRTGNLTEEFIFPEGTPVLEIIFPRVFSSDCAFLRFGDEIMMIDASTLNAKMKTRVRTAIESAGIDHIDVAFNSHPHDDHIDGFPIVDAYCPIGKMILTFEEDYDKHMKTVVAYCNENGIPIEHVGDGDVLTMGPNGEITMRVIQRNDTGKWGANDRSAMLLVQYGERTILFSGDVENRAQRSYSTNVPEGGLHADILKYPHHGQVKLDDKFLAVIDPELVFMNGASDVMDGGKNYLKRKKVPFVLGYQGLTRMRTDGSIWVVDYIYEAETDRKTINPEYVTTTDIP